MSRVKEAKLPGHLTREAILQDYRIAHLSRQLSLIGRKEVLTGKAKFGIFGDGKELPQLAMAHAFQPGDFRSGYYRDQTFMLAAGLLTPEEFFAQLYAHTDLTAEPASGGRQMNNHFATPFLNTQGQWLPQASRKNVVSDVSPTASQMPRLVGLAWASVLYRKLPELATLVAFSQNGNEIAWGTIGDASTSEGLFWEAINALVVLQAPAIVSVWDDGYGISVPVEYQTAKGSISEALAGMRSEKGKPGLSLYVVKGWDYPALIETYLKAAERVRRLHEPALIHVVELTQPQGHSTSGSHERYKSPERLTWEREYDGLVHFRRWILEQGLATEQELDTIEEEAREAARTAQKHAWEAYLTPILQFKEEALALTPPSPEREALAKLKPVTYREVLESVHVVLRRYRSFPERAKLLHWYKEYYADLESRYDTWLYRGTALEVPPEPPRYPANPDRVEGFRILNAAFRAALQRDPRVVIFGEDVGKLGDVNQGCAGLQAEFGELRVADTGIREATIIGQGIGLALRGLRPIAEIQYLDYLLYAVQILSDDVAPLSWRTVGQQKVPLIVRTRGHRLEGIWHSGSPMQLLLGALRGMYILVPRNMTQATGMYNTLLAADEPALLIEVLNGYRLREPLPENIAELKVPLGVPEILREGTDITVVTYGATCRIVLEAAEALAELGVSCEVIDAQTLLPFDVPGVIGDSLRKTGRIAFIDEDVSGGATAYMMWQVLERQKGYYWLDSPPLTIPGKDHRPAYGSDGDYFSKPNREEIIEALYALMHESDPDRYPPLF
ncbi:MAG: thiamine pyrophosphate-dependent enzyme [Bacteroidia bacterium]|jgi:pyruvate/2-oxoglutarate/acetoin dehydrogenase E1 component/TPP-dependent pyruvate/acetoin dehydrogenase alpha subunit|nr:thiamine pyrophosphate-dependent enzyme [Bacteroidia bacterium]GIV23474.1 MAG: transketolase [Bacteroidia bacterium]